MHSYSISNTDARIKAVGILGIGSTLLTLWIAPWIPDLHPVLDLSSPLVVFGILFFLFDRWLWKQWFLPRFTKVIDFSGEWDGTYKSSSNESREGSCKLVIRQTFTMIIITGLFDKSNSESYTAHLSTQNPDSTKLIYSYSNEPRAIVEESQDKHLGLVKLRKSGLDRIGGDYFTDRSPQTKGSLELRKSR